MIISYHDVRSDPDAVNRETSVEFQRSSLFQGLHRTVERTCVWIFTLSVRLHFLDLCFDKVKWQTTSRSEEP